MSPDDIHVVLFEMIVDGQDGKAFHLCLSKEKSIERIGVMSCGS